MSQNGFDTALVRVSKVTQGAVAEVVAKRERQSPLASVKDPIGVMILEAERGGKIQPVENAQISTTNKSQHQHRAA